MYTYLSVPEAEFLGNGFSTTKANLFSKINLESEHADPDDSNSWLAYTTYFKISLLLEANYF